MYTVSQNPIHVICYVFNTNFIKMLLDTNNFDTSRKLLADCTLKSNHYFV